MRPDTRQHAAKAVETGDQVEDTPKRPSIQKRSCEEGSEQLRVAVSEGGAIRRESLLRNGRRDLGAAGPVAGVWSRLLLGVRQSGGLR